MSDILKLSAYEMQKQMEQGQLGALEATEAYLAEIEKREAEVGAYLLIEARKGVESAAYAPMDRILLETDSPYLAPVPLRGKRNNPANTRYVAEKLAEIKGISVQEVVQAANANARKLFGF